MAKGGVAGPGVGYPPGLGGWTLAWFFLASVLKMSGGGSSPRSILHSKAYRHWMYCFFRELAALLDVPTLRWVDSSRHFLFLLTCGKQDGRREDAYLQMIRFFTGYCLIFGGFP